MTRIGLQIPNFTFPESDQPLFERVVATAVVAEQSGFDTVFVMDHFFQLPLIGPPELEMFDSYTLLGGLAARTQHARLGTLVTGVTYRNPALLAKSVTALDVISNGRALLGIGAAWFELEHDALGVPFPPVAERFARLEEALRICQGMFTQRQTTVAGTYYSVTDAWNSPAPVTPGGPPILVGGTGERKTARLAAQYADEWNCNANFVELPRKVEALAGHLRDLGRDRDTITMSCLGSIVVGESHAAAAAKLTEMLRGRGIDDPAPIVDDAETRAKVLPRLFFGDADEVAEQVHALMAVGLDGLVVNMPADAHDPGAVALAGQTLAKALG
ncbi:MAG: LLM class F420-dependent oxidoreductase [Acidimicrobiia bacterium]